MRFSRNLDTLGEGSSAVLFVIISINFSISFYEDYSMKPWNYNANRNNI